MRPHIQIICINMMEKNLNNRLNPKGKIFLRLFLRFLKEYNYFYNYKKAFENFKSDVKFDNFIYSCNHLSPNIIDNTIYWDGTDEGFDYWAAVHHLFHRLWSPIQRNNTLF